MVGVGIGPPNVLDAPNPTSSVMINSTLGAPAGASTCFGKSGVESLTVRPILPLNGGSGLGSTTCGAADAGWLVCAPEVSHPVDTAAASANMMQPLFMRRDICRPLC